MKKAIVVFISAVIIIVGIIAVFNGCKNSNQNSKLIRTDSLVVFDDESTTEISFQKTDIGFGEIGYVSDIGVIWPIKYGSKLIVETDNNIYYLSEHPAETGRAVEVGNSSKVFLISYTGKVARLAIISKQADPPKGRINLKLSIVEGVTYDKNRVENDVIRNVALKELIIK